MGFDFGDVWNPLEQGRDLINAGSRAYHDAGGGGNPTYRLTRGPDGQPQYVPTNYGEALSQQTGLVAPVNVNDETRQALLAQQGGIAGQFADRSQQGYNAYGAQGQQALAGLQAIANGQNSVSAEQLRQGQQANLAAQRSYAASASPQNAAMAARTGSIQMGRSNAGMAGQQALAGLQERNQAQGQYGNLLQGLRGQDLNAALQSRQNAMSGYGAGNTGAPQKSWIETYGPAISGGIAAVASDRRLKKNIKDGDADAAKAIAGLKSYTFEYKDKRFGKGRQPGVMAQDLERAGLGHAVIDTPVGKMVHGAKLATANTAMLASLGKRVAELEGRGK